MSGLTFIVTYEPVPNEGDLMTRVSRRRHDHFVAETWDAAWIEANKRKQLPEAIVRLSISEPQRLLDPELDHTKMRVNDNIFSLDWGEVCDLAAEKNLAADLAPDEMRVFLKCVQSGLSCWSEVVELALMAATSERSES